jgi:hypothetical protein
MVRALGSQEMGYHPTIEPKSQKVASELNGYDPPTANFPTARKPARARHPG